jgi:hypothetical protein
MYCLDVGDCTTNDDDWDINVDSITTFDTFINFFIKWFTHAALASSIGCQQIFYEPNSVHFELRRLLLQGDFCQVLFCELWWGRYFFTRGFAIKQPEQKMFGVRSSDFGVLLILVPVLVLPPVSIVLGVLVFFIISTCIFFLISVHRFHSNKFQEQMSILVIQSTAINTCSKLVLASTTGSSQDHWFVVLYSEYYVYHW